MDIDVGQTIGGRYQLVRLIGRGAMGEVWEAQHSTLGERVAVKLITPGQGGDRIEAPVRAAARFRFEAQVAARLSRKTRHIVSVTDHGEEDGIAYLVMEPLVGETLDTLLGREGPLPAARVVDIVTQVARALTQAHSELVWHRDLKPANVFLTQDEDGRLLVKLLDFGIARAARVHQAPRGFTTAKGIIVGTPSYMSPEQALGSPSLDHGCDLWALATLAYSALAGRIPFPGSEPADILQNICACRFVPLRKARPDLPAALDVFFARAFAKSPASRFRTAAEMSQAFASSVPSDAGVVTAATMSTPPRPPGTNGQMRTAAIVAAILVLGSASFFVIRGGTSAPAASSSPAPADTQSPPRPSAVVPPTIALSLPPSEPAVEPTRSDAGPNASASAARTATPPAHPPTPSAAPRPSSPPPAPTRPNKSEVL